MPYMLWIDCEMTGLNPEKDHILEIAAIVTEMSLDKIFSENYWFINPEDNFLSKMDPYVFKMHTSSGLLKKIESDGKTYSFVENEILKILNMYEKETIYIAGNSIYTDLAFIKKYLPAVAKKLHYRLIDVSTIKILIQSWHAKNKNAFYQKSNSHRALDDIHESIAELKWYKKHFFMP